MTLALSLVFDEEAVAAVRALWQALADANISRDMLDLGYPPHVTLLIVEDDEQEGAMRRALRHVRAREIFLTLGSVKSFDGTSVVWLACDGGEALMSLHMDLAVQLPLEAIRPHYRPSQWTPHMTLQTVGDAETGSSFAAKAWQLPVALHATRLELARFLPVEVLEDVVLRG